MVPHLFHPRKLGSHWIGLGPFIKDRLLVFIPLFVVIFQLLKEYPELPRQPLPHPHNVIHLILPRQIGQVFYQTLLTLFHENEITVKSFLRLAVLRVIRTSRRR